jgi:hypothetical protein
MSNLDWVPPVVEAISQERDPKTRKQLLVGVLIVAALVVVGGVLAAQWRAPTQFQQPATSVPFTQSAVSTTTYTHPYVGAGFNQQLNQMNQQNLQQLRVLNQQMDQMNQQNLKQLRVLNQQIDQMNQQNLQQLRHLTNGR